MNNVSIQDHLSILESISSANVPYRIYILEAALNGKSIQVSRRTKEDWHDLVSPKNHVYDFDTFLYRIKPDVEVYYQYVVMSDEGTKPGRIFVTIELFKSDEDVQEEYSDHKIIKRLDETRIEITI